MKYYNEKKLTYDGYFKITIINLLTTVVVYTAQSSNITEILHTHNMIMLCLFVSRELIHLKFQLLTSILYAEYDGRNEDLII